MQKHEPQIEVIPQETVEQLVFAVRKIEGKEGATIIAAAINMILNRTRIEKMRDKFDPVN